MSRLLINEPPLQVLPSLARKIGLNEALFLQQLHFLTLACRLMDGRRWYSIKVEDWVAAFPFWSKRTIERIITSLRNQKLITTTDVYNRDADDRTLWYAVCYEALEDLDFPTGKAAPSRVRQNGGVHQDEAEQGREEKNAVFTESAKMAERVAEPVEISEKPSAKMADSSSLRVVTTTTPEKAVEARAKLAAAGVDDAFKNWEEHLNLQSGPALNLTLAQWVEWTDAGLASELIETSTNVILMGARATDPSAVLRSRLDKAKNVKAVEVARRAEADTVRNIGAEQLSEGARFEAPTGQLLTVDYVEDGYVFWREADAPEALIGHVLRWKRQGGAA